MTDRHRSPAPGDDGDVVVTDLPVRDVAERAEAAWLITRDSDPGAAAPSSQIARDYAELEDLLGSLPRGVSDDGWHDEVLRTASSAAAARRRTVRWAAAGAFAAAAAVTLAVVIPRAPTAELDVTINHAGPTRSGSGEAVVGDHLVVTARPRGAGDVRVFRSDGTLVARCPGEFACNDLRQGEYTIELTLDAPVQYQVILVTGMTSAPPAGTLNAYLEAAHDAHAHVVRYAPIDVH